MKRMILAATVSIVIGSTLSAVNAGEMPGWGPIPFEVYDIDKNGLITKDEFDAARQKRMELRADEGRMMRNMGNAPEFSYFDTDGDGKVTPAELTEGQNKRMQERGPRGMGGRN